MDQLSNRLIESTSTYLKQHLDNPVHWQLWDAEALAYAKAEDKPILLSIGYAACHWCHVMAHECFEDPLIAELMNKHFVNIKVDRQERPDLDSQYQLAHQLFTGRGGGWPLTVFLDPQDLTPFFAGTYFPPKPSRGMPGFGDILQRLSELFLQRREDLQQQAIRMREALAQIAKAEPSKQAITDGPLRTARQRILDSLDEQYGGIGGAPKFPRCPELDLLALLAQRGDQACADGLNQSLQAMLDGGLYDHLGGGFYRYCVDGFWTIPHFEKMLYDNAQLLPLLAEQNTQLNNADVAIIDTIDWLNRRMALPTNNGTLYAAALDADSPDEQGHSEEGTYYLWQRSQIQKLISDHDYPDFAEHYGLTQPANFENQAWHLRCQPGQVPNTELDQARQVLLEHRQQRSLPTLDTQALCGWNALLAYGLLQTGYRMSDSTITDRGHALVNTLWQCLWVDTEQPRLYQRYAGNSAQGQAFLDDAAGLLLAKVADLRDGLDTLQLQQCCQLANYLLNQFFDEEQGGFWLSPPQHSDLLIRSKPFMDDATPAGNAQACQALLQLGHLTGESRYLQAVEQTVRASWDDLERYPGGAGSMLSVLEQWLNPQPQVLACGEIKLSERQQWLARSDVDVFFIDKYSYWNTTDNTAIAHFVDLASSQPAAAMVCLGARCLPLCESLDAAEQLLQQFA